MNNLTDREATVIQLRLGILEQAGNCQIPECEINSLHGHTLEEVGRFLGVTRERVRQIEAKAIRKSGIDLEEAHRKRQSAETVINRIQDRIDHPEKYWVTGEYGSVKTRSAPKTMYPENHSVLVLPEVLDRNDTIWVADWDCYAFYVVLHKNEVNSSTVTMEVKMHPSQYLDTEVTVFVESTGFQSVVRTSKLGEVSNPSQKVQVDSNIYNYSAWGVSSPTNKTHLQIRINDPDLFDIVGKSFPIEFTALKHGEWLKVFNESSHKDLSKVVGA
tara:strand:+ start:2918 stop:3736 length:819 start_codon:yes stop_codon:yes gene_type:complete